MKAICLISAVALWMLCGCRENERLIYDHKMHDIYYSDVTETRDSMYVSLLAAEENLVAEVKISMLGNVLSEPRRFKAEVVEDRTDAIEGVHYQKLPEYYEFPAGEFSYAMPVVLLKGAPGLTEKPVTLTLRLVETEELGVAYADRAEIRLQIADMLRKPEGDGYYGNMTVFKKLFGEYSRTKHLMIIEMVGHDFWDHPEYSPNDLYYQEAYYTPYARRLYKIITSSTILDENGKVMQGWMVP